MESKHKHRSALLLYVDDSLKAVMQQYAKAEHRSVTNWVTNVLYDSVRQYSLSAETTDGSNGDEGD